MSDDAAIVEVFPDDSASSSLGLSESAEDAKRSSADSMQVQVGSDKATAAEDVTYEVVLSSDQWDTVHGSLRVVSSCCVLGLLLVSSLIGVMLWSHFVQGWRDG